MIPCNSGSGGAQEQTVLDIVIANLNIPSKGMSKTGLYNVQEVLYSYRPPREASRIGVGYKDKGSMTPTHELKFEIAEGEEWTPSPLSVLRASLRLWKDMTNCYPPSGEYGQP